MAIVLGVLFALLLVWRFGFGAREGTESAAMLIPEVDAAEIGVSLDDLREILKELKVDTLEGDGKEEDGGQLPFCRETHSVGGRPSHHGQDPPAPMERTGRNLSWNRSVDQTGKAG